MAANLSTVALQDRDDTTAKEQKPLRVIFQPAGRQGFVGPGTSLLDAARQLGVEIESICGGRQTCGKCQVRIEEGLFSRHGIESTSAHVTPEAEREARYRDGNGLLPGCRLSCAALVQGDVLVTVPEESRAQKQVVRKAITERAIQVNPTIRLCYVELPPASLADERSDWVRLRDELVARFGLEDSLRIDAAILPALQPALRRGRGQVTATLWQNREVIDIRPGYHERAHGMAVDLGTTTIVAHLSELRSGRVLATESCMNPQISYGEDLMSRVSYVMEHEQGLQTLHRAVIDSLNGLIQQATAEVGLQPADVVDLVVVGNTVMHHLFLGIDPQELGISPFAPAVKEPLDLKARDLNLQVARGAQVHVPPVEAGFVGADNVAALIAEAPHQRDEITLLIDVGTNGEIVLGNRQRLLSASSPTGPAFEGAQVRHGMRAAPGAIERVRIDPATLAVRFQVIGCEGWIESTPPPTETAAEGPDEDLSPQEARARRQARRQSEIVKPSGICGSGIIEAVAELFKAGLVAASGRFATEAPSPRLGTEGMKGYFVLAWPHETSTGRAIAVHADDVRAIQLAKGALYAGAKLLIKHYGLQQVDRIVLAGAFGSYIDPEHAMLIGMIPDCSLDQVEAVGNAAGDGALILLLDRQKRLEAAQLARTVEHVQTATEHSFQHEFVNALHLPHMVDPFPHLEPLLRSSNRKRVVKAAPSSDRLESRAQRRARRQKARNDLAEPR